MNQEAQNTQNGVVNLNLLLPQSFKDFIDEQVALHGYGTASEYLCDLVREAKKIQFIPNSQYSPIPRQELRGLSDFLSRQQTALMFCAYCTGNAISSQS